MRSRSRNISPAPPIADTEQVGAGSAFGAVAAEPAAEPGLGSSNGSNGRASSNGAEPRPAQARPSSRRALKNWRVRSRLLLLITIPTLTAVALGAIRIASSVQSALAYQRVAQLATLSSDITVLAQRLEDERDQTVYYIALPGTGRTAALDANQMAPKSGPAAPQYGVVTGFWQQTDQAVKTVKAELTQVGGSFPAQTQQEASTALFELRQLGELRAAATGTHLDALFVVQDYTSVITKLLVLEDATAQGASDTTLSQDVRLLGLISHAKEDASQQRALLTAGLIQGTLGPLELQALNSAQADQQTNLTEFALTAAPGQLEQFNASGAGATGHLAQQYEQAAEALEPNLSADSTTPDDWYGAMTHTINYQMGGVERSLGNQIIARAESLRNGAVTAAIEWGLAILIVLGFALFFTVVVARSMVRPLRRLRAGALEVAGMRLPETVRRMSEGEGADAPLDVEPIDVDSTDEIGEVARAFDQVHREAVRLASNEAALRGNVNAMFVNLSRRSQSLVERQIRLIDDLEQGEQDPERLGNLFQMDHLATRMRRNSENLLVLAGHDVSRRWTQAVGAGGRAPCGRVRDRAVRAGHAERAARHRRARPGRQRRGPPARRAGGERHLVLGRRYPGERVRSPAQQRRRAARHHRPGRGHGRRGDGPRQLAAGQPAGCGRRGVPPDGPVRGRPAGRPARHPGPAPAGLARRADRAGLAARRGDHPRDLRRTAGPAPVRGEPQRVRPRPRPARRAWPNGRKSASPRTGPPRWRP